MNGNCHFWFGTTVGFATASLFRLESYEAIACISTCILGSIFPDIDNPVSNMGQLSVPISTIIGKIQKRNGRHGSHHRWVFHDVSIYATGLYLCYRFYPSMLGFFIGTLSHLFLDFFNPDGIRFFGIPVRLFRIKSGGVGSIILTWLFCIGILVFVLMR